jgi:arsenate reductase (glutaredoxin)
VGARIYHNPRCAKSRAALALLRGRGVEPEIIEYLLTPPSQRELDRLLRAMGLEPRAAMRRKEPPYKALGLDDPALTRKQLIAAMVREPILIERPIVVIGTRAVLARPPDRVLDLV